MIEELYEILSNPGPRFLDAIKSVAEKYNWSIEGYRLISPDGKKYYLTMKGKELALCRIR